MLKVVFMGLFFFFILIVYSASFSNFKIFQNVLITYVPFLNTLHIFFNVINYKAASQLKSY